MWILGLSGWVRVINTDWSENLLVHGVAAIFKLSELDIDFFDDKICILFSQKFQPFQIFKQKNSSLSWNSPRTVPKKTYIKLLARYRRRRVPSLRYQPCIGKCLHDCDRLVRVLTWNFHLDGIVNVNSGCTHDECGDGNVRNEKGENLWEALINV